MENEANNNDATVKMDPVDHDPGRTQVLPEDACPTIRQGANRGKAIVK